MPQQLFIPETIKHFENVSDSIYNATTNINYIKLNEEEKKHQFKFTWGLNGCF